MTAPLSPEAFLERLRAEAAARYHDRHPFHVRMHAGALSRRALQIWVENRYYYQTRIPIKDALILAKSDEPAFRRAWIRRIVDHDGAAEGEGGLADWLALADGVGLDPERVARLEGLTPMARAAGDAYVALVREVGLVEAVASSLTEQLSPELLTRRLVAWEQHYPWVPPEALAYFRARPPRARRDCEEALAFVLAEAHTAELQARCLRALVRKTEILWQLCDAIEAACVAEGVA